MKKGSRALNVILSALYTGLILWIYEIEISKFWAYMGFTGEVTLPGFLLAIAISMVLGALLPTMKSARSLILTTLHYISFLPTVIILTTHDVSAMHPIAAGTCFVVLMTVSRIQTRPLVAREIKGPHLLRLLMVAIVAAIFLQIIFGGLSHFNLNIATVYDYRRDAAATLPGLFGYIFSNISKVFIPLCLVLAVIYKKKVIAVMVLICAILLFGMTQHKSVLFTPIFILILYYIFSRNKYPSRMGYAFVLIPFICLIEVFVRSIFLGLSTPAELSSLMIRRTLLIPPLLDSFYIDHFSENARYFWSTSRFSLGIASVPNDISAPFLIGERFFGNVETSANTGIMGSGYANAGLPGIILYSSILGVILSAFNSFGRRYGADFVAAVSIFLVASIVTSTDLTTAVLTHGLFVLFIIMLFLPKAILSISYEKVVPK